MKIFIILSLINLSLSIEWVQKNKAFRYPHNWSEPVPIDDGSSNIIIIDDNNLSAMRFSCSVKKYLNKTDIAMDICYQYHCSGEKNYQYKHFKIESQIDRSKPNVTILQITIKPTKLDDRTSRWYCQAKDLRANTKIQTNDVEIRDVNYWKKNYVNTDVPTGFQTILSIYRKEMPLIYACPVKYNKAPVWVRYEVEDVQWILCETGTDMTPEACIKKDSNLNITSHFDHIATNNSLILTESYKTAYDLDPIYILCTYAMKPIFVYGGSKYVAHNNAVTGVKVNEDTSQRLKTEGRTFKLELLERLPIIKGSNLRNKLVQFEPFVRGNNYSTKFYFKDKHLIDDTRHKITDKYLKFKDKIDIKNAGIYTAVISGGYPWTSLNYTFEFIVKGPPIMISKFLRKTMYVNENEEISIVIKFMKNTVKKIEMKVNFVSISNTYGTSKKGIDSISNEKLNDLEYLFNVNSDLTEVIYIIPKIRSNHDHAFQIFAENDYGKILIQSSFFVIPKLKFMMGLIGNLTKQQSPNNYDCVSKCYRSEYHKFMCNIDTDQYRRKNIQYKISWMNQFNHSKIDIKNGTNFYVSTDKKSIMLLPVMDAYLNNSWISGYLICNLQLQIDNWKFGPSSDCANNKVMCSRVALIDKMLTTIEPSTITKESVNVTVEKTTYRNNSRIYLIIVVVNGILLIFVIILLVLCCLGIWRDTKNKNRTENS